MIVELKGYSSPNLSGTVSLRCPSCRQLGTFEAVTNQVVQAMWQGRPVYLGQRRCPNVTCCAHVFVIWDEPGNVLASYPPQRIDFDASHIPSAVVNSFEEALNCHANGAFTAAAIMVRRTMEILCDDKKATGKTLNDRLKALASLVILPPGLLRGLDNLRLLGNDAAHVEAKEYGNIGKTEVELAIDVCKEVLKAVYQLEGLVSRLEALKKAP